MNLDGGKTLALIYDLTGIEITDNLEGAKNEDVAIQCSVTMPGKYAIKVYTSKEEKKLRNFSQRQTVFLPLLFLILIKRIWPLSE